MIQIDVFNVCKSPGSPGIQIGQTSYLLLAASSLLFRTSIAFADRDPKACAPVLQPDVVTFQHDRRTQIAYLDSISEEQYNQAKANGALDALIPVEGTPIKI